MWWLHKLVRGNLSSGVFWLHALCVAQGKTYGQTRLQDKAPLRAHARPVLRHRVRRQGLKHSYVIFNSPACRATCTQAADLLCYSSWDLARHSLNPTAPLKPNLTSGMVCTPCQGMCCQPREASSSVGAQQQHALMAATLDVADPS